VSLLSAPKKYSYLPTYLIDTCALTKFEGGLRSFTIRDDWECLFQSNFPRFPSSHHFPSDDTRLAIPISIEYHMGPMGMHVLCTPLLFTMLLMMQPARNHINYKNAHEMKRMHVICQHSACPSQLAMVSIKRLQFLASYNHHHHLAHSPLSIDFCFFS